MITGLVLCENCKKKVRQNNVRTLFSGSMSGFSCVTHLCGKCANNKRIMEKMQKINDRKLDLMDGCSI